PSEENAEVKEPVAAPAPVEEEEKTLTQTLKLLLLQRPSRRRNSSERRRAELHDTSPLTSTLLLSDPLDGNETAIETTDEALLGTTTDEVPPARTSAKKRRRNQALTWPVTSSPLSNNLLSIIIGCIL
ncbi:unnamed protein product, partial [Oikopleura dioica]